MARRQRVPWTSRAARTADSRAPSIQAGLTEVWQLAKCSGPSEGAHVEQELGVLAGQQDGRLAVGVRVALPALGAAHGP
ncbi:hypothetical protein BGK72_00570 [Streptomyces agglomeratus]|nr:hypothetical protein BGK72_00570 [Streptomyces agglomeratus]